MRAQAPPVLPVHTHASNSTIKLADNTTVVGLSTNIDETAYREEVRVLVDWCQENNHSFNVNNIKELIVDFRRQQRDYAPIHIDGAAEKLEVPRHTHP